MPCCYCGSGSSPLHGNDGHTECISCLGKSHAVAALTGTECSHCENFSLASLFITDQFLFRERLHPHALPFSSSQGPVRKKQRGRGLKRLAESELMLAQIPRALPSPQRESSPILFSRSDQYPSAGVSDLVSFEGSEDELLDGSMSLTDRLRSTMSSPDHGALPTPPASILLLHPP